jgi:ATP synthase protein I
MNDEQDKKRLKPKLSQEVEKKAVLKLKANRNSSKGVWFGLGMMGLIGWSVAIPTILGAFLGLWLDHKYPGGRSWTLALLVGGLATGCLNAWHWVGRENKAIQEEQEEDSDE